MRIINPTDVNNLLSSLYLAIQLQILDDSYVEELNIIEILKSTSDYEKITSDLVLAATKELLEFAHTNKYSLELMESFSQVIKEQANNTTINNFIYIITSFAVRIMSFFRQNLYAAKLLEILLLIAPDEPEILLQLSTAYQDSDQYIKGINTAKKLILCSETLMQKIFVNHTLIRALLTSTGYWDEAC